MVKKPVIVIFGAGNIGRGFIGQIFSQSGYDVIFVDAAETLVAKLNKERYYPLQLISNDTDTTSKIGPVSAIMIQKQKDVNKAILQADIIATAVGVPILPLIAKPLAEAFANRKKEGNYKAVDILVCENKIGAGDYLRSLIAEQNPDLKMMLENKVGFVETSIGRMVPVLSEKDKKNNPLLIRSEPYSDLPVDAAGFKAEIPQIKNIMAFTPFHFYHQRKLYIHNMGHALTAFLGYLSGYSTIAQAIEDKNIQKSVRTAMQQVGMALSTEYLIDYEQIDLHIEDLISRFGNHKLQDTVIRVGRDPLRKLAADDRLAGALHYVLKHNGRPSEIALGIAAAICFDAENDPTVEQMKAWLSNYGTEDFLQKHCGLKSSPILDYWRTQVIAQVNLIKSEGKMTEKIFLTDTEKNKSEISFESSPSDSASEVIVAGHLCLDLLPTFDPEHTTSFSEMFVPGRLNHVGESVLSSGGTVSNTGIALRQLGFSTGLMAKIGDDLFGQGLLKALDSFKSGLQLIIDPESSTSYSYVIAPPGVDRMFLHHPGANDTFCSDDLDYDLIAKSKLFHFGYPPLMRKMYEDNGVDLSKMFSQIKERGVTTSLDMAYPDPDSDAGKADWLQVMQKTLPYTDIFLPSIEELVYMLNRKLFDSIVEQSRESGKSFISLFDMSILPDMADKVLEMGCAVVIIKMGFKGLYMKTATADRLNKCGKGGPKTISQWSEKSLFAPSFLVTKIASTTGAGDASIAGVLSGILNGQSAASSLQLGCAAAAQKIQIRQSFGGIDHIDQLLIKIMDWPHEDVKDIPSSWQFNSKNRIWLA